MKIKNIILGIIMVMALLACDDFLSKEPSKNANLEVSTAEHLELMLNGHLTHHYWIDKTAISTDNWVISPQMFDEQPALFQQDYLQHYLWDTSIEQISDDKWAKLYQIVWDANLIINSVDNNTVTGSQELKSKVKAEAHMLRAYTFFELALNYCLHPSAANMSEPGVPLRMGTDFEESVTRSSIGDTYAQIEADLTEALKLDATGRRFWRASQASVNAFAARYFLYRGNFDKAQEHALNALQDYSTMLNFEQSISQVTSSNGIKLPSTYYLSPLGSADYFNFWIEQFQFKTNVIGTSWVIPSQGLLDLYDPNDLRSEFFMVENYSVQVNYKDLKYPGYVSSQTGYVTSGPSVSEMYYIIAECEARNGNYSDAMAEVEKVRVNRFRAADYQALTIPENTKDAVQLVMDERRREFPYTLRWYDIRRINVDDLLDHVTITRTFYPTVKGIPSTDDELMEYTLEPDSRLYARPLGNDVISLSNGETEQNHY